MPAVALMPWIWVEEPFDLGRVGVVPFEAPGASFPEPVRRVLQVFRHGGGAPLTCATLFTVDGEMVREYTDDDVAELTRVRLALTFSALLEREFFGYDYCNADFFQTVIQQFRGTVDGITAISRRRDGRTSSYCAVDEYEARAPEHVAPEWTFKPRRDVIDAALAGFGDPDADQLWDALHSFERANTDAPGVLTATELVLMCGAFQSILGMQNKAKHLRLTRAFAQALGAAQEETVTVSDCSRLKSGSSGSPRERWFQDFYATRGKLAHGRTTLNHQGAWSADEHLLLGAFIFPRLVLLWLAERGYYQISHELSDDIAAFDHLLCQPPTLFDKGVKPGSWVWREALWTGKDGARSKRAVGVMQRPDVDDSSSG